MLNADQGTETGGAGDIGCCSMNMKCEILVHHCHRRWKLDCIISNLKTNMKYHDRGLPAAEKFKAASSAGKVMLTASWNVHGLVHLQFTEHCIGTVKNVFEEIILTYSTYSSTTTLLDLTKTIVEIYCPDFTVLGHPPTL
jgi:hypothetical protein